MSKSVQNAFLFAVCVGFAGLAAETAVVRECKIAAQTYAGAYADWALDHMKDKGDVSLSLSLPSVDIYDPSGAVVYHGQKVDSDAAVLESLPQKAQGLHAGGLHPSLRDLLAMVPELGKEKASILSGGRYSVVSFTSSGCPKCPLQDAAVAKLKRRAAQANINVLEVHLQ